MEGLWVATPPFGCCLLGLEQLLAGPDVNCYHLHYSQFDRWLNYLIFRKTGHSFPSNLFDFSCHFHIN